MHFQNFAISISVSETEKKNWWNGSGLLTLGNETYEGTYVRAPDGTEGSAISLTDSEKTAGEVGSRMQFAVSLTDASIRRIFSRDLGPVSCNIKWIYRLTKGGAWTIADETDGELSNGNVDFQTGVYTADVEGELGRYGKGKARKWSHNQRQQDYPGDDCFEKLDALERGDIRLVWN